MLDKPNSDQIQTLNHWGGHSLMTSFNECLTERKLCWSFRSFYSRAGPLCHYQESWGSLRLLDPELCPVLFHLILIKITLELLAASNTIVFPRSLGWLDLHGGWLASWAVHVAFNVVFSFAWSFAWGCGRGLRGLVLESIFPEPIIWPIRIIFRWFFWTDVIAQG